MTDQNSEARAIANAYIDRVRVRAKAEMGERYYIAFMSGWFADDLRRLAVNIPGVAEVLAKGCL
jgi:hypothetical protein